MTDIALTLENKLLSILSSNQPGRLFLGFVGPRGAVFGTVHLTPAEARAASRALLASADEAEHKATPPPDYPFCKASPCPHWRGYCARDPACND